MATLKIAQKLSLDSFKKLQAQLNDSNVNVVNGEHGTHVDGIRASAIIGRVKRVIFLGKKLEVETDLAGSSGEFRFGQVNDRYFLFRKG